MWEVGEVADDGKSCKDDDFKIIKQGGVGVECLKLKKDKYDDDRSEAIAILASRLEKRRYAAYVGCNTEGRKWEGITFDPVGRKMYTAMSSIDKGMEVRPRMSFGFHASRDLHQLPHVVAYVFFGVCVYVRSSAPCAPSGWARP